MKVSLGKNGRFVVRLLTVLWTLVLFGLALQSGEGSGHLSSRITAFLFGPLIRRGADAALLEHIVRKLAHGSGFALEGALLTLSMNGRIAIPCALVLSVLNELCQMIAENRACTVTDMLIDFSGALVGIAFITLLTFLRTQRQGDKHD